MNKILCTVCASALMLGVTACGTGERTQRIVGLEAENANLRVQVEELKKSAPEENPIDRFFGGLEYDGTTLVMNVVAGCQANAWEAEVRHLAEELKSQLPLQEDRDLVDAYIFAVEEQVQRMEVMAIYPVSDVSIPEPERINSSGTLRGVLSAEGRSGIWRDTFDQLRWVLPFEQDYVFVFDASGAEEELSEWMT